MLEIILLVALCVILILGIGWVVSAKDKKTLLKKLNKDLAKHRDDYLPQAYNVIEELRISKGELHSEVATLKAIVEKLGGDLGEEQNKYSTLLSQKKSSEVRVGNIAESMAPFLKDFPYNPDTCRFLGMPVDYVVFDLANEWITFLEVKSGNSQLTTKQRKIRELIEAGKVRFDLYRIKG